VQKSAETAESAEIGSMWQLCEKSAESAGLLGDVAAVNINLTRQPNSYQLGAQAVFSKPIIHS